MDKKEAYKILECKPGANRQEIETRYTMLTKRYRHDQSPETQAVIAQIVEAYDLLTGRTKEQEDIDPKDLEVVLGKERREWRNLIAYGWKPALGILLIVAVVFSIIYSAATNEPPDYKVAYMGAYADLRDQMEHGWPEFLEETETAERPFVDLLPFFEGIDPKTEHAMLMKAVLVVSGADKTDLIVADKVTFDRYASQGAFEVLEDVYKELEEEFPEAMNRYVKPAMAAIKETPEDDYLGEPVPIEDETIYGLDFSEYAPLNGLGIVGQEEILAIPVASDKQDETLDLIRAILRDGETLEGYFTEAVEKADEERASEEAASQAKASREEAAEAKAGD